MFMVQRLAFAMRISDCAAYRIHSVYHLRLRITFYLTYGALSFYIELYLDSNHCQHSSLYHLLLET